jgi:beta-N-acetylhexosaminidase
MYGTSGNINPGEDMSSFHLATGINLRVGNNVIRDRIMNFPIGATDEEIIAEFNVLKNIINDGCSITGAPGLNDSFLERRLLYLIPEYGSPNPEDWHLDDTQTPTVTLGFENFLEFYGYRFQGKRVGLVANHTAINPCPFDLGHVVDVLHDYEGINLTTLFAPAPGLRALKQDAVIVGSGEGERAYYPGGTSYIDIPTGLTVHRLWGDYTVPTATQLEEVDLLLLDMQDSGVRFNSHIELLADIMKGSAQHGVELIILDRPSMVNTATVDGPVAEAGFGYEIPIRYGMTIGELALLLKNDLGHLTGGLVAFEDLNMTVVRMSNFQPEKTPTEMNLQFIAPYGGASQTNGQGRISPIFIGSHHGAYAYATMGLIEPTLLFDGRGTTRSFETIGAPFVKSRLVEFQEEMNSLNLSGVNFRTVVHLPWNHLELALHGGLFQNQPTYGLQLHIYDFATFNSTKTGIALLTTMETLFPDYMTAEIFPVEFNNTVGNTWVAQMILEGSSTSQIMEMFEEGLEDFKRMRERNLLYN